MMSQHSLSDTQLVLLSAAAQRDDRRLVLPERLRGGAAQKVLSTLAAKGLIEPAPEDTSPRPLNAQELPGTTSYQISRTGIESLGIEVDAAKPDEERPGNKELAAAPEAVSPMSPAETPDVPDAAGPDFRPARAHSAPRSGSKLADVIALLDRVEGASIDELIAVTGWLPHTSRLAPLPALRFRPRNRSADALGRELRRVGAPQP